MRHIDAGLRTDLGTASAAVTGSGDEIAAVRLRTGAKREGGALDRPSGQIEPLTASLIQLKDTDRLTRCFARVDVVHVRVLGEELSLMGCVDLADLAVQRQSGALHGRIAPNAGQ